MKRYFYLFAFVSVFMFSCKDKTNNPMPKDDMAVPGESRDDSVDKKDDISRYDNLKNLEDIDTSKTNSAAGTLSGRYIKSDRPSTTEEACNCNCLEVSLTGNSEFCLEADKTYIDVRFEKKGENFHAFYVKPSSKNTNKELPWNDFSTSRPIAKLTPHQGGLKLDWIGFSIDGNDSKNYATYGKKILEGNFTKK